MVQNLPCPEVSHSCSLTRFPSNNIVVVLYAEIPRDVPLIRVDSVIKHLRDWKLTEQYQKFKYTEISWMTKFQEVRENYVFRKHYLKIRPIWSRHFTYDTSDLR